MSFLMRLAAAVLCTLVACKTSQPPQPALPVPDARAASSPKELAPDAALAEGHVAFRGMVRPSKGGYHVGGAFVDDNVLKKALAGAPGSEGKHSDWFVGAVLRIEGELRKHTDSEEPDQKKEGVHVQRRAGTWFQVVRLDSATLVEPAKVIEGTLSRSKGFFALGGHLISRQDLAWSLAPEGGREGERVRLHGQPRTVVCHPNAQCLLEGSLPLFDVGRAERLP